MAPLCLGEAGAWRLGPLLGWGPAWRLLFLGLAASAACYAAWNLAVARLGGVRAAVGLYLNPVVGVASAALLLGEPLGAAAVAGVGLTLGGVALSARSRGA